MLWRFCRGTLLGLCSLRGRRLLSLTRYMITLDSTVQLPPSHTHRRTFPRCALHFVSVQQTTHKLHASASRKRLHVAHFRLVSFRLPPLCWGVNWYVVFGTDELGPDRAAAFGTDELEPDWYAPFGTGELGPDWYAAFRTDELGPAELISTDFGSVSALSQRNCWWASSEMH